VFAVLLGMTCACAAPLALAAPSLPVALAKLDAQVLSLIPALETRYQEIPEQPS
jgi:hypothetical protein